MVVWCATCTLTVTTLDLWALQALCTAMWARSNRERAWATERGAEKAKQMGERQGRGRERGRDRGGREREKETKEKKSERATQLQLEKIINWWINKECSCTRSVQVLARINKRAFGFVINLKLYLHIEYAFICCFYFNLIAFMTVSPRLQRHCPVRVQITFSRCAALNLDFLIMLAIRGRRGDWQMCEWVCIESNEFWWKTIEKPGKCCRRLKMTDRTHTKRSEKNKCTKHFRRAFFL